MLHAPDFLGFDDAIQMAKQHGDAVKMALRMKKLGNDIVNLLGGREIHPINVRVGGFYKIPSRQQFRELAEKLKWGRDAAREGLRFVSRLDFPDFDQDYEFVSLRHPDEYPFSEGRLVSNKGLDIDIADYDANFEELHVEHSNALHSVLKERGAYFCGPSARYSLNFDRLPGEIQDAAREAGLEPVCRNPFKSILVRSVEVLYAFTEALRILDNFQPPDRPYVAAEPRAGVGHGCTEAPRGILYHQYRLDEKGLIQKAKIVPPTSQNQKTIENDLWNFIPPRQDQDEKTLTWLCEQAIRNYDPCISCATHFLKLKVERE